MKVIVPLAQGLEEIEAVTIIDVLRRANINVTTAGISGSPVNGSHNIEIASDTLIDHVNPQDYAFIVFPGGMPGSKNLKDDSRIISLVKDIYNRGGYAAAICAAPMVLGHAGILKGKNATCYPGFEDEMAGANYIPDPVVVDGKIITGKGPGCAIPFALKIVEIIKGKNIADELKNGMQVYWM